MNGYERIGPKVRGLDRLGDSAYQRVRSAAISLSQYPAMMWGLSRWRHALWTTPPLPSMIWGMSRWGVSKWGS